MVNPSMEQNLESYQKYAENPGRPGNEVDGCRVCGGRVFPALDLGRHPFANHLAENPNDPVFDYPLMLNVCGDCSCAQLSYCADDIILYSHYRYLTPDSKALSDHYQTTYKFLLDRGYIQSDLNIVEIGSNIGRLLEYLKPYAKSILGVDPAENVSRLANQRGIPTFTAFFNSEEAKKIKYSDGKKNLIIARHCFAHASHRWP